MAVTQLPVFTRKKKWLKILTWPRVPLCTLPGIIITDEAQGVPVTGGCRVALAWHKRLRSLEPVNLGEMLPVYGSANQSSLPSYGLHSGVEPKILSQQPGTLGRAVTGRVLRTGSGEVRFQEGGSSLEVGVVSCRVERRAR